jgi:UDP-N-acetylglucosamine 4-epimerase
MYQHVKAQLSVAPRTWLVTGAAGFIGSHLVEHLLQSDQNVIGLDNFSTGHPGNLTEIRTAVGDRKWARAQIIEGDIRDPACCRQACSGAEIVLHQAALGSVPRSLADPVSTHESNVSGFLNMLVAARQAGVKRFIYASSSSVYGDHPELPKREERVGRPLSPYAASKSMDEIYAGVFARAFGLECIGLRYFNVFGPRQDPAGAYAAVIPRWIAALLQNQPVRIFGDGETSRDFSYIDNIIQANLLAATTENPLAINETFNVAVGETTTLNELFRLIQNALRPFASWVARVRPIYEEFRPGDVRHSHAAIDKAQRLLGYQPTHRVQEGLQLAMRSYWRKLRPAIQQPHGEPAPALAEALAANERFA